MTLTNIIGRICVAASWPPERPGGEELGGRCSVPKSNLEGGVQYSKVTCREVVRI